LHNSLDVDDIMQEAWIRYDQIDKNNISNLEAWLTTVVTRLCLDSLRRNRRFESDYDLTNYSLGEYEPESSLELNCNIEMAFNIILAELSPSQQVAFILHDVFDFTFVEVGNILQVSEGAARRQASRARRHLRNSEFRSNQHKFNEDEVQRVVSAFLAAAQEGNVDRLIAVLDPNVVRTTDSGSVIRGSEKVIAETIELRVNAQKANFYLLRGRPVIVVGSQYDPKLLLSFTVYDKKIIAYNVIANRNLIDLLMSNKRESFGLRS
jgi:RNA polymerase sigma factor, sigma-70 family